MAEDNLDPETFAKLISGKKKELGVPVAAASQPAKGTSKASNALGGK